MTSYRSALVCRGSADSLRTVRMISRAPSPEAARSMRDSRHSQTTRSIWLVLRAAVRAGRPQRHQLHLGAAVSVLLTHDKAPHRSLPRCRPGGRPGQAPLRLSSGDLPLTGSSSRLPPGQLPQTVRGSGDPSDTDESRDGQTEAQPVHGLDGQQGEVDHRRRVASPATVARPTTPVAWTMRVHRSALVSIRHGHDGTLPVRSIARCGTAHASAKTIMSDQ
jgi:hypothetical protein